MVKSNTKLHFVRLCRGGFTACSGEHTYYVAGSRSKWEWGVGRTPTANGGDTTIRWMDTQRTKRAAMEAASVFAIGDAR